MRTVFNGLLALASIAAFGYGGYCFMQKFGLDSPWTWFVIGSLGFGLLMLTHERDNG